MIALLSLALVLVILAGCGQQMSAPDPAAFRAVEGLPGRDAYADATLEAFRERHPLDASRVDLNFVQSSDEQIARCHGDAECTTPETNGWRIDAYWPDQWKTTHAYMLAHELCHVWYFQAGEHGDPGHTHTECYARPGLYQSYPGEIGVAQDVALEVTDQLGGGR